MDGRTTDAYPWQKLTWPMARWANKNEYRFSYLLFSESSRKAKILNGTLKTISPQVLYVIAENYNKEKRKIGNQSFKGGNYTDSVH
jgi:hypothetical protein